MLKHLPTTTALALVISFAGLAAAQSSGSYRQQQNEHDFQSRQPRSQHGGQQEQQRFRAELALDTENALVAQGYDVGPVDGNIDAKSRAGIRAYQRDAGLEVNGQTSPQLLAHIENNGIKAGGAKPMENTVGSAAGQAVDQLLKRNR